MKNILAFLMIGLLQVSISEKPSRAQYCFNRTETIASAMFPRTQAYCYNTSTLCSNSPNRTVAHNVEVSMCQRTTMLYCITVDRTRWCSTDQYLCNETAQYFGIDNPCHTSSHLRNH